MGRSYVVTGGGRGIGRAIVSWLTVDGVTVVAVELDGGRTVLAHDPEGLSGRLSG